MSDTQPGPPRRPPGLALLAAALVVGFAALVVGAAALVGIAALPSTAQAQGGAELHHALRLGLKDPKLRNRAGAEALAERLRGRLLAAQLSDHKVQIDGEKGEVLVEVFCDLKPQEMERFLTAPGEAVFVGAELEGRFFEDLRGALPEGISVGYEAVGASTDVFLRGPDAAILKKGVDKLALWDYTIHIGPIRGDDASAGGFRTWLVRRGAPSLGTKSLRASSITLGQHPNYHYVTVYWGQGGAPDQGERLEGQRGLRTLTTTTKGGHLLLIIDGELKQTIKVHEVSAEGQLNILMAPGSSEGQLAQARHVAGLLGSRPHPCEVVVIFARSAPH